MAPQPQEHSTSREELSSPAAGERVVISGMAGVYPNSPHVKELERILYKKINPVTDAKCRWNYAHPEVRNHTGKAPGLDLFDGQFFKVHYRLGNSMDAMSRKILEQSYQAIYDAGVSPDQLSGENVGVYVGSCFSETEKIALYLLNSKFGLNIAGCCKSMFANRVSYWLNTKGPSMNIDDSGCSSMTALEQAYLAIKQGTCNAAIVGACDLCLHPQTSVHYGRVINLCQDGKTKSFDANADGLAKSEAVNVLFLQKAKDAKRVYAEVVYVKSEFRGVLKNETGGPKYGFYRDTKDLSDFLNQFYEQANLPPKAVEYVEAFGSAMLEVDKAELEAIDEVFCKNRRDPLLVGSVMSNIGYTEAAAGISAITKVLLGYHNGSLAANLHCESPRRDIAGLRDGRMQIVTEHSSFGHSYAAVNSIAVTGVNAHVLLHGHFKPKDINRYNSDIPRLVTISGIQEIGVQNIFDDLKMRTIDPEEHALFHNIHQTKIFGHLGRGYIVLDTNKKGETVALAEEVRHFEDTKRPLWFVYSGMGSQWAGMGSQLMKIPVFAAAIERCRKVLEPKGIDIVHIITSPDKTVFDNILNSFVGIAAMQIGLTDVLTSLGIVPDKIIGHSVGELGCAYADGCFTAEEMMLCASSRGQASVEVPFIRGSMAAVGIGYEQIKNLVPPEIDVACHNGPESSTISGPADKMKEFVAQLTAKGIFAKEVPCSNIAYHSRYIAKAGPSLFKYLSEVIREPKLRSERWVSSSVPQEQWGEEEAKYSSAYYHTHNLLSPVLFEEACRLIPANAVTLEIAPHGLLQAILKRSLPASCKHISLTVRGKDNALTVLNAVGKLYMEGYLPKVQALYSPVEFPVSTGTPMLSHLVTWAHTERWDVPLFITADKRQAAVCNYIISTHDKEHRFLEGCVVRGKNVYPFAGALVAAWDTLAMSLNKCRKQISVEFRDVQLYAQPPLLQQTPLRLSVALHRVNGQFEIMNEDRIVASGKIYSHLYETMNYLNEPFESKNALSLKSDDIYRILHARDYFYSGDFRSIHKTDKYLTEAQIVWNDNWITFLDGILQFNALRTKHDTVAQEFLIDRIGIDLKQHKDHIIQADDKNVVLAQVLDVTNFLRCGGVLIGGIQSRKLPVLEDSFILKQVYADNIGKIEAGDDDITMLQKQMSLQRGVSLRSSRVGEIDSLHWVETESTGPGVSVTVHFAALNDVDVKRATGEIPLTADKENFYGMDFSGVTDTGVRVMGVVESGAASGRVAARAELLWPVPAHWSLEDAATVPSAYAHAFYILHYKAGFHHGYRASALTLNCHLGRQIVLVHGATGALGQALVSILLAHGCEVFATVSDRSKKRFLLQLFPQLQDDHIGNSRDQTFCDTVLHLTQGMGCNLVISCLKPNLKDACLNCLAGCGIIIDTLQLPHQEKYVFGMSYLSRERSYYSSDFRSIFDNNKTEDMKLLRGQITKGIAEGYVRPLSRVTYSPVEVSRAFRLLAAARHRGRVLIRMQDIVPVAEPRLTCSSLLKQVIVCDKQNFGLQFVERLISCGARNLHLHSADPSNNLLLKAETWRTQGVTVEVSTEDLTNKRNMFTLLSENNNIDAVEGIFVVATDAKEDSVRDWSSVVGSLDLASRELCPSLRYFVVINGELPVDEQSCLSRMSNGLPVTFVNLPALRRFDESKPTHTQSSRSAVNATEKALRSSHHMLEAHPKIVERQSLMRVIANIAEIDIDDGADDSQSLVDLGLDLAKVPLICTYLRDTHNLAFLEKNIPELTLKRLKVLDEDIYVTEIKQIHGLQCFFQFVDPDELLATHDIVHLSTLIRTTGDDDEFDVTKTHLCIIPGMEGHHGRFQALCERLKLPALVLQPGLDFVQESARETAERYAKTLLKQACVHDNFYILGYENGVSVALEVASIFEDHGFIGTVFCLGGTPEEFQTLVDKELSAIPTDEALQNAVAGHMFSLMMGHAEDIDKILHNVTDWKQKVEMCVRMLLGRVSHSAQYARNLIEAAYARVKAARSYKVQPRELKSKLVLLHASSLRSELSPAAGLQRYSQQPVSVHELEETLPHATRDLRCSAIINNYLDPKIVQAYEESNLCETYICCNSAFKMNYTEDNGIDG